MGEGVRKVLLVSAMALIAVGAAGAVPLDAGDFGDAPDGRPTGYSGSAAKTGSFPSVHDPDGAHASDTATVHLGPTATIEREARQVDADTGDDGVAVALRPCATSTAFVEVNAPTRAGTAYVNLFFDWKRDGTWGELDRCAPEWAVRNVAIDLSQQRLARQVYAIPFRAGAQTRELWFRAVVSHGRRWSTDDGSGAFARGEVEDYRVGRAVTKRVRRRGQALLLGATCTPSPLVVVRGQTGRLVLDRPPGTRALERVTLAPGVQARTPARTVSVRGAALTYRTTPRARAGEEVVRLAVTYENLGTLVVPCRVKVIAAPPTRAEASRNDCTLVGPSSDFGLVSPSRIRARLRLEGSGVGWNRQCGGPADATVGTIEVTGFGSAVPTVAVLHLGDPTSRVPPPTWPCAVTSAPTIRCSGTPLLRNRDFHLDVGFAAEVPPQLGQLHIVLVTPAGQIVGAIESARRPA